MNKIDFSSRNRKANPKFTQDLLAQVDQATWSLLSLISTLLYMRDNELGSVGLFSLVLFITYSSLSLIKSRYLFANISKSTLLARVEVRKFTNKILKPVSVLIGAEAGVMFLILLISEQNLRSILDLSILFILLSFRDITRSVGIYFNLYIRNIFQNTLAIVIVTLLYLLSPGTITLLECWSFALLCTTFSLGYRIVDFVRDNEEKGDHPPFDSKKQRLLNFDTLSIQVSGILSMIAFTISDPALVGKYSVTYTCIASVAITIGTGFTGKIHLQYLRERNSYSEILKKLLFTQVVLSLTAGIVIIFDFVPRILVGSNWLESKEILVPAYFLYSTVLLTQFFAFPLLINSSTQSYVTFRIVSFVSIYISPYLLVTYFSVLITCLIQVTLFAVLSLIIRRDWVLK